MADFLPRRDAELRDWTRAFASGIAKEPERLGLSPDEVEAYREAQAAYAEALVAATRPTTRGVLTVRRKDEARRAVVAMTRRLARRVRAQPGVGAVELVVLGLMPRYSVLPREALWALRPVVRVEAPSREVRVRIESGDGKARRPAGSVGAAVFWAVDEELPTDRHNWRFGGNTTKPRMTLWLPEAAGGGRGRGRIFRGRRSFRGCGCG